MAGSQMLVLVGRGLKRAPRAGDQPGMETRAYSHSSRSTLRDRRGHVNTQALRGGSSVSPALRQRPHESLLQKSIPERRKDLQNPAPPQKQGDLYQNGQNQLFQDSGSSPKSPSNVFNKTVDSETGGLCGIFTCRIPPPSPRWPGVLNTNRVSTTRAVKTKVLTPTAGSFQRAPESLESHVCAGDERAQEKRQKVSLTSV